MRLLFFINLLLIVLMVSPDPVMAAHLLASKCGCGHDEEQEEERVESHCPKPEMPCCLRMRTQLESPASEHPIELHAAPEACCDVDQPQVVPALEPVLPRLDLSALDGGQQFARVALPAPPRLQHVQRVATRTFARRPPARAPPLRPSSRQLNVRHCVWRL